MYENLSDEDLQKLLIIAQMTEKSQGDKNTINALNEYALSVLLPETNKMDELASLYSITGDEKVKSELLNEYYKTQGIDPKQRVLSNIYSQKFAEDYALDDKKYGDENAYLQTIIQEHPELLAQYYEGTPLPEKFKWKNIGIGMGSGAAAGAGAGAVFGGLGALPGSIIGAGIGGIGGLITAISDKNTENAKDKRARLESLVSQYRSNLPNN